MQVFFKDGGATSRVEIEYPLGHRRRREEGIPLLLEKFRLNLRTGFGPERVTAIQDLCADLERLEATSVTDFVDLFVADARG